MWSALAKAISFSPVKQKIINIKLSHKEDWYLCLLNWNCYHLLKSENTSIVQEIAEGNMWRINVVSTKFNRPEVKTKL